MNSTAVSVAGLRKTFPRAAAPSVDDLTLDIESGGVFGLLGPNGSGKTTTLRMIFGLVAPDAGTISIFGAEVPRNLALVLPRMGALIEGPTLFNTFTGRRNLEVLAALRGIPGGRIDEVLDLVDLGDRQRDPVRTYSLGMRQRLGIACALLSSPSLLVLDEPSNGLDPAGMVDMRGLVRRIAESGDATVVVSSHLLGEMEKICDRVAIMSKGRLVATGTPGDLAAGSGGPTAVSVEVSDLAGATAVLEAAGLPVEKGAGPVLLVPETDQSAVLTALIQAGIAIISVRPAQASLENTFLALTKDSS